MRRFYALLPLPVLLAACSAAPEAGGQGNPVARDPVVARALNDPLMSDPDLSARNEANALLGFADQSALPLIPATTDSAQEAREAGRLELLDGGSIPPLPRPVDGRGPLSAPVATARDGLAALGAPANCLGALTEDFRWAADLPQAAVIMPYGMVVQAGGADTAGCGLRIIRYQTQAAPEDVLQYHYVRAGRAGLSPVRHAEGGDSIAGRADDGEALVVAVRKAAGGMTAVDLFYRSR
ncbi:hypothetical protein OIK40_10335 [Erythrobacter sp. sf7]|uniref:Lipoprotein n=1 Tax=Erythrobacter fulvus TaxID=2987523 RepID=A0ABT5JS92_9SPHN|nr:hypothetical protein [Erythrobacter fulvus]MDC8755035.1 hypothetical protein [Erythrobacter fulvus]